MTIQAISSVSNRGYVNNNVSFGAKKKNGTHSHSTTPLKAVPLAALIAMSPLNNVEASNFVVDNNIPVTEVVMPKIDSNDVVESKEFDTNLGMWISVSVVKDKTKVGSHKIYVEAGDDRNGRTHFGYVEKYNHAKHEVVGDDGITIGSILFDQLSVINRDDFNNSMGITDKKTCSYVKSLMSKYKTNIQENNVNYLITPNGTELQAVGTKLRPTDNWSRTAEFNQSKFGKGLNYWTVKTKNGNYTVMAGSTDGNDSNFENIYIKKEGDYKPLEVGGIFLRKVNIFSIDATVEDIELGEIAVKPQNADDYYQIYNNDLWRFLRDLIQSSQNNNALGADVFKNKLLVGPTATLQQY